MKKIKQMKLNVAFLTIVALLSIGLSSCTDEFAGDPTTGKPGYMTLNLKTLKPAQNKIDGAANLDYQIIKNLNIFVFDGSDNLLLNKYFDYNASPITSGKQTESIQVNSLPTNAYVVAVANYGQRIDDITDFSGLEAKDIITVRDTALGLHMTGKANIEVTGNGYTYISNVSIAPVQSKITVDWVLTDDVLAYYDVTGIYVVNAIDKTNLTIVRENTFTTSWGTPSNITPAGLINVINSDRTASTGLAAVASRDYNFYGAMTTNTTYLSDEVLPAAILGTVGSEYLDATYTQLDPATKFHYYIGENYSNNSAIPDAGQGVILADATANAATNQNTLVVIRVTPLSTSPAYIKAMGHKYYTYEFTRESNLINSTNLGSGAIGPDATGVGFSVRRKTNYSLTFNLSNLGAANPFERLKTLTVDVTADAWDPATVSF